MSGSIPTNKEKQMVAQQRPVQDVRKYSDKQRETDGGTAEASAGCQEVFRQTKRDRWWHSRGQCRMSGSIPTNKEKQMVAQQRPVQDVRKYPHGGSAEADAGRSP